MLKAFHTTKLFLSSFFSSSRGTIPHTLNPSCIFPYLGLGPTVCFIRNVLFSLLPRIYQTLPYLLHCSYSFIFLSLSVLSPNLLPKSLIPCFNALLLWYFWKSAFNFRDMCSWSFCNVVNIVSSLKGQFGSCLFSLSCKACSRICACVTEYCRRSRRSSRSYFYCRRSSLIRHEQWSNGKSWMEVDDFEIERLKRMVIPLTKRGRTQSCCWYVVCGKENNKIMPP